MNKFKIRILVGGLTFIAFIVVIYYGFNVWYVMQFPKGGKVLSDSILNIDKDFQFPKNFPPDPGEEGKETIEGIDSDHDGVRDDIQRWIYAYFPNATKKQMALRQMARYFQNAMAEDFGLEVRKKSHFLVDRAVSCQLLVFTDELRGDIEVGYLEAKVFNTYQRTARYFENENKITTEEMIGTVTEPKEPCDNF